MQRNECKERVARQKTKDELKEEEDQERTKRRYLRRITAWSRITISMPLFPIGVHLLWSNFQGDFMGYFLSRFVGPWWFISSMDNANNETFLLRFLALNPSGTFLFIAQCFYLIHCPIVSSQEWYAREGETIIWLFSYFSFCLFSSKTVIHLSLLFDPLII